VPVSSLRVSWARLFMNIRMANVASSNTNGLLHETADKRRLNGLWKSHREGSIVDENKNGTSTTYENKNDSPPVYKNGVKSPAHEKPEHTTLNNNTNENNSSELYKVSSTSCPSFFHLLHTYIRYHTKTSPPSAPSSSSKAESGCETPPLPIPLNPIPRRRKSELS
jgi:hypothetical protein